MILRFLTIVVFASFAIGCGPSIKLKRAERLIKRAVADGAKVRRDTTFAAVKFKAPSMTFETKLDKWKWGDTLYVRGKDGEAQVITKIIQRPGKIQRDTIIKVVCPEQEVKTTTPVVIDTDISAGYTFWNLLFWLFVGVVVGFGLHFLLRVLKVLV